MKSFQQSGILITQAKVSLQTTGLANQILKIKDQWECPVKLINTRESAKSPSKKQCKRSKNLTLEKTLPALTVMRCVRKVSRLRQ